MAEALVSLLIEHLGPLALGRIGEEVKLVKGVKEDAANLKNNLEDIQALLEDAEKKQLEDATVRRRLDKLKNASHDMDDVLDELNTTIIKYEIQKEEKGGEEKIKDLMSSLCFCLVSKVNKVRMSHDIAHKIKKLNEDLDRIAKEKVRYQLNEKSIVERPERKTTTFIIDETRIHGRDKEKKSLVDKLCVSDDGSTGPDIIPIMGMGGLGKTTLAQLAYNDERIKAHFDKRMWICVSDPFDGIKFAKAIIEGLENSVPSSDELNTLLDRIQRSIEGKRFLLVLDDVWLESYNKWECFQNSLKCGATGSKIIVTTRKEEVAIMMGVANSKIDLKNLSEEHCWSIFSQLAFVERTIEERRQLEIIGRQIARKSSGLPLVAKTLGGLMRFKKTLNDWEDTLNDELWDDVKVKDIFAPFLLSYYDLSPSEKRCLLYCSIFPKDYEIRRNDLIEMWMSQGYFGQTIKSRKQSQNCFESLCMRSFFQEFGESSLDRIPVCKMHNIVHDFVQFLVRKEYILIEGNGVKEEMKLIDESTRHLTIVSGSSNTQQFPTLRGNTENLRSLYVASQVIGLQTDSLRFSHLKCLRTLSLVRCGLKKLPGEIGKLVHLRYLDVSYNRLKELPEVLFNLCNLQTLRLTSCSSHPRLSENIRKLVSLRNLYLDNLNLEGLPKGITRLTCLQTLDAFVVPKDREAYMDLADVKMLNQLQFQWSFSIHQCSNMQNVDEAEKINLMSRHLVDLKLHFRDVESKVEQNEIEHEIAILEALQPHPELKSLAIGFYIGATFPKWMMSLVNLTSLTLNRCVNGEMLPPLGKLPSLESLFVSGLNSMKRVGPEFLGAMETDQSMLSFPRLKILHFYSNYKWEVWEGYCRVEATSSKIMPCLESLKIVNCNSLATLPDFLQLVPMQQFSISYCHKLRSKFSRKEEEWSKISHIPNIKIDGKYVQRDGVLDSVMLSKTDAAQ